LSYEQAAHRRLSDAGGAAGIGCVDTPAVYLTCPASFGVAAVLTFTKGKNHWFYVDYKQDGTPKELALKLDKTEYEQVLRTAHEQTGKDVEILVPQKRKSPGKK
jgi:vacuolar-type H+-ATPase subunit C/Vma6